MRRLTYLLSLAVLLTACDAKTLQTVLDTVGETALSNADIANGLKEALQLGVGKSVNTLSVKDGFYKSAYKIAMPDEATKVIDKLKFIPGFQNVEEVIIQKINQSAEDAAKKASPIFLSAIKGITFNDAMGILTGNKTAATNYLHGRTYNALYGEFSPVIENSLNKFGALDYWADAVNTYNKIPLVNKLNPDLKDHVTTKSLSGLFSLIEKKEAGIRSDVGQRTSDLLKRVFAKQD